MKWKKVQYPSKQTMNLIVKETNYKQQIGLIIGICFLFVLGGSFIKIHVFDRFHRIQSQQKEYASITKQIEQLKEEIKEYSSIQEQYYLYTDALLEKAERQEVDRMEILKLVEQCAFQKAKVTNILVQENQVTLTIRSKSLSKLSEVVSKFETNEFVSYVSVSTATSNKDESKGDVIANIIVELKNVGDES